MHIKPVQLLTILVTFFTIIQTSHANDLKQNREPSKNISHIENESLFRANPFLQNPTDGGITVSWFTNVPTQGWVEFGESKSLGNKAETIIAGQVLANVKQHKVRLTRVIPGKTYYYRIASREILAYGAYDKKFGDTEYSEMFKFSIPNIESTDFTALIFNDLHKNEQTLRGLMTQVSDIDYDFVMYNGDCIDDPHNEESALSFLLYSNEQVGANEKPVFYIRGNHEIRGAYSVQFNNLFDYVGGKTYGVFSWGDTRFVMLDCGEDKPDSHPVYGGLNNFKQLRDDQVTFLKEETKTKAFKNAAKRVLIHHIPLYGMRNDAYIPCYDLWSDILNQSEFTLAINGHTHRFAYHEKESLGNAYPIVVGGGHKPDGATVMILRKKGNSMFLKVLGFDGKVLGEYKY